jgi:hypothetical protein
MMTTTSGSKQNMLLKALDHLRFAIELLDLGDAPGHIAAHADLALNQLEVLVAASPKATDSSSSPAAAASGSLSPF